MRKQPGFTLIELLVSLAIFAVMAAATYSGLNQMLRSKEINEKHSKFLNQLQKTYLQLKNDIYYMSNQQARDEYGQKIPAFTQNADTDILFQFSSASRLNPLGLKQNPLLTVRYYLEDGKLIRSYYPHFNRAPNTPEKKRILLKDIELAEVRFLDNKNQWQQQWPPVSLSVQGTTPLPKAIELSLNIQQQGKFVWLFRH